MGNQKAKKLKVLLLDVKLHTKLKHKIISYYFSAGWKKAMKSGKIFNLYYVDLFAGDGICSCDEIDKKLEKYLPKDLGERIWKPPFFDLMNYANDADFNLKCFFNDIDENNIKSLIKEVNKEGYSNFIKDYYWEDANVVYKKFLNLIEKPNIPSLFYIDPTNHAHLSFSTIEEIAKFKDDKTGRMPELIINFMLNSIFMAIKRGLTKEDLVSINRFLGTNFDREDILKFIQDKSEKTHKIFLNIFLNKLNKLGYYCNYHLIKSTVSKAPIYYLIFATFHKDVDSWYKNINSYVQNLEEDWIKKNFIIKTMSDYSKDGQTFLLGY